MRSFACFLSGFLLLAAPAAGSASPWSEKPYGILLVSSAGGADWTKLTGDLRKSLGPGVPLADVHGVYGTRELQRAVDRLQGERVRKIAVVPLELYSQSAEIEQLQYLLGMREYPSSRYLAEWRMKGRLIKRVKAKVPMTLGSALDASPAVSGSLAARAEKLSKAPREESVVLIGWGAAGDEENAVRGGLLESLAAKLSAERGFKSAHHVLLRPATKDKPRLEEDSRRRLRTLVKDLSVRSRVIVLPHLLSFDGRERRLKKDLEYLFLRLSSKALLPDEAIARWVESTAAAAAAKENMATFKDEGKTAPADDGKRNVQ